MMQRLALIEALRPAALSDNLNARHLIILLVLHGASQPMRHRDLAKEVGCPRPSLTRLHQRLHRLALVEAIHSNTDGRDVSFVLTEKGVALADELLGLPLTQSKRLGA